jgi:hypothetical protein
MIAIQVAQPLFLDCLLNGFLLFKGRTRMIVDHTPFLFITNALRCQFEKNKKPKEKIMSLCFKVSIASILLVITIEMNVCLST